MNILDAAFCDFVFVFLIGYVAGVISSWVLADISAYYRSNR
jgi:preprotein translocase subunit SecF